jgi:hypothetical protein
MSTTSSLFSIAPKRWPAWLPLPANRPDVTSFVDTQPGETADYADPAPGPASGWFASSLDLKLGLEVVDLGTVEPQGEWNGILS